MSRNSDRAVRWEAGRAREGRVPGSGCRKALGAGAPGRAGDQLPGQIWMGERGGEDGSGVHLCADSSHPSTHIYTGAQQRHMGGAEEQHPPGGAGHSHPRPAHTSPHTCGVMLANTPQRTPPCTHTPGESHTLTPHHRQAVSETNPRRTGWVLSARTPTHGAGSLPGSPGLTLWREIQPV